MVLVVVMARAIVLVVVMAQGIVVCVCAFIFMRDMRLALLCDVCLCLHLRLWLRLKPLFWQLLPLLSTIAHSYRIVPSPQAGEFGV
jgi:hypothetical protein